MEPEYSSIEQGQPLKKRIAAAHVRLFMRQYGVELGPRPVSRRRRQNDSRAQKSYRDRSGATRARQPVRSNGADCQTEKQHERPNRVDGEQSLAPVPDGRRLEDPSG